MNPIEITQVLKQAFVDYLTTTFDVNKDGKEAELARKIRASFERPEALFTGPFLEMILPYKTDSSLRELCQQGVLSKKILNLSCFAQPKPEPIPLDAPLYTHQKKAIQKLCSENRSIVVSSGTGSGKTECFSIPIVSDLLEDDTPGVRALLVYPLNALVNDQLDRLRILLRDTDISFGRFTSELPDKADRRSDTLPNEIISRFEIREEGKIPQILITNYAMLEYLLLRPEDSILFNTGLWKYIVLDEAHTYSGAQGIEVAMLLRRLKQRLGKQVGDILYIATSATLVNDDKKSAINFAQKLFCEDVQEDDIIFGEENKEYFQEISIVDESISPKTYLHEDFDNLLEEMRKEKPDVENIALWMAKIGLLPEELLPSAEKYLSDMPGFLYEVLRNNTHLNRLQNWMIEKGEPAKFTDVAHFLFPNFSDTDEQKQALFHLIELGALARPGPNQLSLLPAKYHLFARPPQGIWACINPGCPGKEIADTNWSRIYSTPHKTCDSCGARVYPIHLCRQCGQVYIACHFLENQSEYDPAVEQLHEGYVKRYFTWSEIEENLSLADIDETEEEEENKSSEFRQEKTKICLSCGKEASQCSCEQPTISIPLYDIQEKISQKRKGQQITRWTPITNLQKCPRCGSKSKKDTEIATSVNIYGAGPLANLTYELYRKLSPATNDKIQKFPGEGRKLLTFCDSRQGAARFAAFLQDIANKQNYRHIIPKAIDICMKEDEWGEGAEPSLVTLSKQCAELAWKSRIIQNDSDTDFWRDTGRNFPESKRKEVTIFMAKQILGEFTTGRRSRQSLELMGLVGISYFNKDDLPDINGLSKKIGLISKQTITLIAYLLDGLRYQKAIKLPKGINADDSVFGPNRGNPRFIRQGKPSTGQVRFIGETARQRRRQYMGLVLEANRLDASDENIKKVLTDIWDWLVDETDILTGSPTDGYQLTTNSILFSTQFKWYRCKKCQRLLYRGTTLPCPYPNCGGKIEPVNISITQKENYFYKLFLEDLIPIRVEEHTAQLDSHKGQEYQRLFNDGRINVLSCSTTFEMGIDLGDLQAIAMRNVPPTVANYRQRAGRAGRRTSGTAFILTWASARPHDQAYYDNPIEIIGGQVAVPGFVLDNEPILRRHINALLFSLFLRYRKIEGIETGKLRYCGDFFDCDFSESPHISFLDKWIQKEKDGIKRNLKEFANLMSCNQKEIIENGLRNFLSDIRRVNEEHYQPVTKYYREQIQQLAEKLKDTTIAPNNISNIDKQRGYYQRLLYRMRGINTYGFLINYLSNKGVLPSYSFPLHTVELMLPYKARKIEHLRLERDLRLAIREYAPGSDIVADKRVWTSERPIFWKDTAKALDYRICEHCHNLEVSKEAGIPLLENDGICSVCGEILGPKSRQRKFVEPDGFMADPKSGKPAKQYINIKPNQMRSALIPEQNLDEEQYSNFVYTAYKRKGKLLYVNEGVYGKGFSFSLQGFELFSNGSKKEKLSLGHIQTTDTLHIRFVGNENFKVPPPYDESFWLSLMYAIIHAASHALQIERRDIDGVLSPRKSGNSWEQTIVLYDNVPGGAGFVKTIRENILLVLEEAYRVLNCNDCAPDTSCYHCLRDYNNQYFHHLLKKESAMKFLESLIAELKPLDIGVPGSVRVVAPNLIDWLLEKIKHTQQSLNIAVQELDFEHSQGEKYALLDTLNDLLQKDCEINLYLKDLPDTSGKGLSFSKYLQLIGKGLKIWKLEQLPKWQVIIDIDTIGARAICSEDVSTPINLSGQMKVEHLITTTTKEGIEIATRELHNIAKDIVKEFVL